MLGDPATELLEQASRIPTPDAYAAQQKMLVLNYARQLVAENERLKALVEAAYIEGIKDGAGNLADCPHDAAVENWKRSAAHADLTGNSE